MQHLVKKFVLFVFPPTLACSVVMFEAILTGWMYGRGAALPIVMFIIGSALLNKSLRHFVVVTLCYGVSFLAIRDTLRIDKWNFALNLPPDIEETLVMIVLLLVASLAGISGVMETLKPGTILAGRSYFAAAGIYFMGIGLNLYVEKQSWQAVVLIGTGVTAIIGCFFVDRFVLTQEEEEEEISDEAEQAARVQQHRERLAKREWKDPNSQTL